MPRRRRFGAGPARNNRGAGAIERRVSLPRSTLLAFVALIGSAAAQQPGDSPAPEPSAEAIALCTTWRLTQTSRELAAEIKAVAVQRVERARRLAQECKARAECTREERVSLEQEVRDATYQQTRAEALAASFEERASTLRKQLESLRGEDAIRGCNDSVR